MFAKLLSSTRENVAASTGPSARGPLSTQPRIETCAAGDRLVDAGASKKTGFSRGRANLGGAAATLTAAATMAALLLVWPLSSSAAATKIGPVLLPDVEVGALGKSVILNLPQMRLFVYQNGSFVKSFPVAVGKNATRTPMGDFKITGKSYNPTWHIPLSIQKERGDDVVEIPPGPGNPLGPVFVRVGDPAMAIGIHGTNNPRSVPGARSHGCIRMRNTDALLFAKFVDVRNVVSIIYQRYSLNQDNKGDLWLQIHPNIYKMDDLDSTNIEQSVDNWLDANPDKTLTGGRGSVRSLIGKGKREAACLTCEPSAVRGKGAVARSLTPVAWTLGLGDGRNPAVFTEETGDGGGMSDLRFVGLLDAPRAASDRNANASPEAAAMDRADGEVRKTTSGAEASGGKAFGFPGSTGFKNSSASGDATNSTDSSDSMSERKSETLTEEELMPKNPGQSVPELALP